MEQIFNANGLLFWNEKEIKLRETIRDLFSLEVKSILLDINPAWKFYQIEAPILTPTELINPNYTEADVWLQQDKKFVLRPETTPGSYEYANHLLKQQLVKPPFCVFQSGKSFRIEQDQTIKQMRLKEFYQLEFQCIYTADTAVDYMERAASQIEKSIKQIVGLPARLVLSDRLPNYSLKTLDVEIDNGDKWMEVCSMSLRTDFKTKVKFKDVEKELRVFEIALGLDRCVYNFLQK